MKAKFITVEGTEGVGKTTNIEFIKTWLQSREIEFIATREPGGTPLAEEVRDCLLRNREELVDSTAELLLVFAARAQHINTLIRPALERGIWVLCDRFTDATFAYQGAGRGLDKNLITLLENEVQKGLHPDLTLYLDIDIELGLERASLRGEFDRFEKEQVSFFEKVREGYKERVAQNPSRYAVIEAGQALQEVQIDIKQALEKWFPLEK